MQDEGSVASTRASGRTARHAFWAIWWTSLAFKLWIASHLAPFGDEAFYWQESRAIGWSYSDVPPFTALLIRLGEGIWGPGEFGMRSLFLALGSAIPWLLVRIGRHWFDESSAYLAGIAWLLMPLGTTLGILALPDVPLTFFSLLSLGALLRAANDNRWRDWLIVGASLALTWTCHYRAAMLLAGGVGFALFTGRGRAQLARPGFWFAFGISLLGLLPLWIFNVRHAWAGLSFQLVDRHPWVFHGDALIQPLEQAITTTPLLYVVILAALWTSWRRRDESVIYAILASSGATVVLAYFVFGLFADDLRFRLHWPLPGYLPAVLAIPLLMRSPQGTVWRRAMPFAFVVGAFGSIATFVYLALAASPQHTDVLSRYKMFPATFVGWREAGAVTQRKLDEWKGEKPLLVADNFLLGAELDFVLRTGSVYSLDSERNRKHGRALQLRLWERDETALVARHGSAVMLVVEETAGSERDRAVWYAQLCRNIEGLRRIERLSLFEGRKRFAWYSGFVGTGDTGKPCAASLDDLEPEPTQQSANGDQRQTYQSAGIGVVDALEQTDAKSFALETSGAIERLLAFDIADDLGPRQRTE